VGFYMKKMQIGTKKSYRYINGVDFANGDLG
jgi:hypothetical protein